jgi:hypothetical protein
MISLYARVNALLPLVLMAHGALVTPVSHAASDLPSVPISADYRYAYHDPETPAQAQETACREALRLAVSTATPVRDQIGSAVDPDLFRTLVQNLAAAHVTDYRVEGQFHKGKTVYCKVSGALKPETVQEVLAAQRPTGIIARGSVASSGELDRNRALQVLAVEEQDGMVIVTYRALRRLDWATTAYPGSLQGLADVMVDFYDAEGVLIRTYRHPARRTQTGDDVMQPGQIGVLKVPRPLSAKTYRAWLVK